MARKVIIIGGHPIADNLLQQYETKGYVVDRKRDLMVDNIHINEYDELCLLAGYGEDDKAVAMLGQLSVGYDVEKHNGNRLICHLLLQSNKTLRMLRTCDFCDAVRLKIDVYPFTLDEEWSRGILLDYQPITIQSNKQAHLVIFGFGEVAEMTAINAALVAHFPNYIRNHSLRTRITIIDADAEHRCIDFIKRYKHLFDNSYYRVLNLSNEEVITKFHKPMYDGIREDFVDVEWEFVEAESWDVDVRQKLQMWACSDKQLLTVVMAYSDGNKNISEALHLPNDLYNQNIPIHIYGQHNSEYDITLPLVRMAKNVNYIYDRCYDDNLCDDKSNLSNWQLRYAVEINSEERERSWAKLSNIKRMSSIYNAMTIPTKMRSIGLKENEWTKFYDISQQDIELLAQVEHNRWSVEELILGYRPCTDEEQKLIESDVKTYKRAFKTNKIHYDLRAYKELRPDETGKAVEVYDLCLCSCLPLITNAFANEEGGCV